jgi:pimeloyl-ACP methyl ester carboxylesterase
MKNLPLKIRLVHFGVRLYFGFLSTFFPRVAARKSYDLFFKPQRFNAPKKEVDIRALAKVSELKFEHKTIKTYEWGSGDKVVLFIHGWNGRGTQVAYFLKPLLDQGYRVISFDGPAHGASTGNRTNLIEFAELVHKLCENLPPIEAIVGHSFGGMVSSYSMYRYQLPVKRVISIAAPFSMISVLRAYGVVINISEKIQNLFLAKLEHDFNIRWQEFSGESIVQNHTVPALIVHDTDDKDVDYNEAVLMNQHWKNSRLLKTEGLGHRRILKDAKIVEEVLSFIKS